MLGNLLLKINHLFFSRIHFVVCICGVQLWDINLLYLWKTSRRFREKPWKRWRTRKMEFNHVSWRGKVEDNTYACLHAYFPSTDAQIPMCWSIRVSINSWKKKKHFQMGEFSNTPHFCKSHFKRESICIFKVKFHGTMPHAQFYGVIISTFLNWHHLQNMSAQTAH